MHSDAICGKHRINEACFCMSAWSAGSLMNQIIAHACCNTVGAFTDWLNFLQNGSVDAEGSCMLLAAAASSLCVGKPGAMPSLPDRASVDKLLQQQ